MPRKAPCKECPFRKNGPAGWIGKHESAKEIIDFVRWEQRFPCHMDVNRLVENGSTFELAVEDADPCAGAYAYACNTFKLYRNKDQAAEQVAVGPREDVFETAQDMIDHHDRMNGKITCAGCGGAGRPLHPCIYAVEIHGDTRDRCNCCDACHEGCRLEV